MGSLDFTITLPVLSALIVGVLQPVYLWLITRIPGLKGRNPLQFLLSSLATLLLWIGVLLLWPGQSSAIEIVIGAMILLAGGLFYLEIWALMSRGYTLGLLLTLLSAERPLTEIELAQSYRGGDGIGWIMRHRIAGLEGAGLLRRDGSRLRLTAVPGGLVARLYKICIWTLGLRKTG